MGHSLELVVKMFELTPNLEVRTNGKIFWSQKISPSIEKTNIPESSFCGGGGGVVFMDGHCLVLY